MWRDSNRKNQIKSPKISNSRLRLVVAVIFLLIGSLVYQLFNVQIRQCDWYTALASSQHQIYSKLKPERGRIFFSDKIDGETKTYPLATNNNFAFIYVVPKDIPEPEVMAEKLYEFFDQKNIQEQIDEDLKANPPTVDPEALDIFRDDLINKQKEILITGYLQKLDKPGDPYEPLENKVADEDLLKLYAFLANSTSTPVTWENLELKNERVMYNKESGGTELKIAGLDFDLKKYRFYPENEVGSHLLGFVSYIDEEEQGRYGLEEFFNEELFGKYGSVKSEKGGAGNIMIVNDREYIRPELGSDLVLTIDRNIQFKVCEELRKSVEKHQAEGGSVIVMNPETGAIIAMCSVPDFDPNNYKDVEDIKVYNNPAIFSQYEPGSVFKTVTLAIAIDQDKISPNTLYKDEGQIMIKGWNKPIKNADFSSHGPYGTVDMSTVLENSLNTGAIFAMTQVGPAIFADYVKKFGFGERTGIELGSESPGDIGNLLRGNVKDIDAATASFGQGIAATPLQMLIPYQAIANKGMMMKPYIVESIIRSGSKREDTSPRKVERVISEKTANTVSAMLVNVVEKGHAKGAAIPGYYIGGKTGTAQVAIAGGYSEDKYVHTFIGIAPIDHPAFVMLTKIDNPQGIQYAEASAVPLWHDIADFILKYYRIPKTR